MLIVRTKAATWMKGTMINCLDHSLINSTKINCRNAAARWETFFLILVCLAGALPRVLQACIVTNLPPTVCVTLLPDCQAKIVIKGYTTYGNVAGSQFCSCAFAVVPSILSVDLVEIRQCDGVSNNVCHA